MPPFSRDSGAPAFQTPGCQGFRPALGLGSAVRTRFFYKTPPDLDVAKCAAFPLARSSGISRLPAKIFLLHLPAQCNPRLIGVGFGDRNLAESISLWSLSNDVNLAYLASRYPQVVILLHETDSFFVLIYEFSLADH